MEKLAILLLIIQPALGIIGYDCGARTLNITTLSLLEVGPCEIPMDNLALYKPYVQLLQIDHFTDTTAIQCKIEYHRTVYYCGAYSHISIVNHGEGEYIAEISRKACATLYNTGTLRLGQRHEFYGIRVNETTVKPITFAGHLTQDGTCNGESYADPYGSWENVVVQGTVKITVKEVNARVALEGNKIHLPSGTSCTLSDAECLDFEGGQTFWDPVPTDKCKFSSYTILYEGYVEKMVDLSKQEQAVYSIYSKDITFALAAKGKDSVCGYNVMLTEHPKLVIFETTKNSESFANHKAKNVDNLDMFTYVNSKFVFVERHIRGQIRRLYQEITKQQCQIEREMIMNALAIAVQAPDQFAYNLMKGPGYMAMTAGEVVHVIKCIPVEVKVEHSEECYAELQVTLRNQTRFLTPKTHILKSRGTKTTCNSLLPSYYLLDENWYKILPKPTDAKAPHIIQPMTKPTWRYVEPASLATSGIYTEKDLDDLNDHIMFPIERAALLNEVAREIHGHPATDNEGTIGKLLNEGAMERILESTWTRMWKKFTDFGIASAGVIAIIAIIQLLKMLVEIIINGFALHRIYGWSIHLLGAFWTSIAQLLIYINTPVPDNDANSYRKTNDVEHGVELMPQGSTAAENDEQTATVTNVNKNHGREFFSIPS